MNIMKSTRLATVLGVTLLGVLLCEGSSAAGDNIVYERVVLFELINGAFMRCESTVEVARCAPGSVPQNLVTQSVPFECKALGLVSVSLNLPRQVPTSCVAQ
ncbi:MULTISPECIES: hypothetical protein [Stenotrophomonas]|uniref:hypothetical protein n=1 Tax=Stenotrophomonas TaxID=40323 RepID=UPI0006AC20DB|nr:MULTISPECIES: hypothetical protein [Stenotrophomonas]KOQ66143.1 hypothetical protein ABW42_07220 [Stenotrophomonas maltophilia]MCF3529240.1 hypothetical protein [Stenotrophomonas maltophilia]MCF3533124.1 hypothetical protein [Stenotrophomonas maltophilia]OFU88234.1 hypothetical protein HMPREF3114_19530 [Stenotrophomonas sp. HMSC10F07]